MKKILLLAVALNVGGLAIKQAQGQSPSWVPPDSMRAGFAWPGFEQNHAAAGQIFKTDSRQNFSGDVQPAWVARHNEQGHARDWLTAMVRDRSGNIFMTGNSGTVKYNAAGVRKWVVKGSGDALAVDGAGNVYVMGRRWKSASYDYKITKYNSAGIQKWTTTYKGAGNRDFVGALAVDRVGNVYVTGRTWSSSTHYHFAMKYNSAGAQEWVQLIATKRVEGHPVALALDSAGNVYVAGSRWRNKSTSSGFTVVKYDSAGTQKWVANYNQPENYFYRAVAIGIDDAGNVYVTGNNWGDNISEGYATVKFNSAGVQEWAATYSESGKSRGYVQTLAVDGAGNVYVTGRSESGQTDIYVIIKYNSAGTQKWVQSIAIAGHASYRVDAVLAVDRAGSVYLAGITWKLKTSYDYLIVKYDSTGSQVWNKSYNGPGNGDDRPIALAVDETGNVYVGGSSYGVGTFSDYTLSKYDAFGMRRWSVRHDEPTPGAYDVARAMCIDGSGNIFVTGYSDYVSVTIKYDAAGARKWVARAPLKEPFYNIPTPKVLVADGAGNVYITGFCGTIKYNSAGVQEWVANTFGKAIAVDGAGNVFVTPFDSVGQKNDYIVVKYNSAGQEQWIARYNGSGNQNDVVSALAADGAGNVYATGANWNGKDADYVTIKYDSSGHEQWVARYDSPKRSGDKPTAIALDKEGNIYVTGGGGYGSDTNFFTVKYNPSGIQQWAAKGTGDLLDLDDKGNVYVAGRKRNGTNSNYITAKYNAAGVREWMATFDGLGSSYDEPVALALDGAGNVYVTGKSLNGASVNCATVKYNSAGKEKWVAVYNLPNYSSSDLPVALGVDATGNAYVAGTIVESATTGYDFITIKYKSNVAKKSAVEEQSSVISYQLAPNYPNPFSPFARNTNTTINFSLPETGGVVINIYAETGQLVRTLVDRELAAGRHQLSWNGRNQSGNRVAAGVYFCRMTATGRNGAVVFMKTNRMTVVK